jgi:hypothetical protein
MLDTANDTLKYVGTHGDGTNSAVTVPSSALFPPMPKDPDAAGDIGNLAENKYYRAVFMSFTLAISEGGLQQIIFSPAQAVMKAYLNMMRETNAEIIDKVAGLFHINKKGKVTYDRGAAQSALNVPTFNNVEGGGDPLSTVQSLADTATRVIADISDIKNAGGWKKQSEKLAAIAAGKGHSGLDYENFLKTVVQLVDPLNISADVFVQTDKNLADEQNYAGNIHYFNNRNADFDKTLSAVTGVRERFTASSAITD